MNQPLEHSSSERKAYRGKAMNLDPAVHIGKNGLTPSVLKAIDEALNRDGLIKIKISLPLKEERESIFNQITESTQACLCGTVGKTASFYRPKQSK